MFDQLFFRVFKYFKDKNNTKANRIALIYISLLQCSLLLLLVIFSAGFVRQMNMNTITEDKVIILFCLACLFIVFKNWIQYSGKKRKVLNAKMLKSRTGQYNIWSLWLLPLASLGLSWIIYQAI